MDRSFIDAYIAQGPRLRSACAGLAPADLTARPGPGAWSIHELVVHLADSEAIGIDRMKRVLTEIDPPLLNADESAYIAELCPHAQALDDALTLFEVNRRQMGRVLRELPDAAFARAGVHNLRGRRTLEQIVRGFTDHLDHHLGFLLQKRERLGKPIDPVNGDTSP